MQVDTIFGLPSMTKPSGYTNVGITPGSAAGYPSFRALPGMNSASEFIATITKLPLVYQPGTVWEYSESFDVLAAVIEKITGKSLGNHLAEVNWPLGMKDTDFHVAPSKQDRVAKSFPLDPLAGKSQNIVTIEDGAIRNKSRTSSMAPSRIDLATSEIARGSVYCGCAWCPNNDAGKMASSA